ncbi:MAG: MlrC C-terminal domain-containing protein, partial [Alphaproteobacteria bacterium]
DPEAARAAHAAGEGATIEIALGGKLVPGHRPVRGRFVVEKLAHGPLMRPARGGPRPRACAGRAVPGPSGSRPRRAAARGGGP